MITLFNRREAYITYSMQEQSEIRSLLAQSGIDLFRKGRSTERARLLRMQAPGPVQEALAKILV